MAALSVKTSVIERLAAASLEGVYVSGETIASELGVSRAAVWKAIKALQDEGYDIEAVHKLGYRFAEGEDYLTDQGVRMRLQGAGQRDIQLFVKRSTGSTNDDTRALAQDGAPEFTAVVAGEQTQGRGRRGRPFYSLGDTGVYLSIVLRPHWGLQAASFVTAAAAVSVCRALSQVIGVQPSIKWVNDVYVGPKKCVVSLPKVWPIWKAAGWHTPWWALV